MLPLQIHDLHEQVTVSATAMPSGQCRLLAGPIQWLTQALLAAAALGALLIKRYLVGSISCLAGICSWLFLVQAC